MLKQGGKIQFLNLWFRERRFNRDERTMQDFPACLVIKIYYFTAF